MEQILNHKIGKENDSNQSHNKNFSKSWEFYSRNKNYNEKIFLYLIDRY